MISYHLSLYPKLTQSGDQIKWSASLRIRGLSDAVGEVPIGIDFISPSYLPLYKNAEPKAKEKLVKHLTYIDWKNIKPLQVCVNPPSDLPGFVDFDMSCITDALVRVNVSRGQTPSQAESEAMRSLQLRLRMVVSRLETDLLIHS